MLEEQDCVTCYRNSPVASEGPQSNLTPGEDPNIYRLPKGRKDVEDWEFIDAIVGESVQSVGVKRKLLNLQDKCRAKEKRVTPNVAEAAELAQELLRSSHVLVDAAPS